jgi:DNA-binding LacI/PurR family transcriptional regulator
MENVARRVGVSVASVSPSLRNEPFTSVAMRTTIAALIVG